MAAMTPSGTSATISDIKPSRYPLQMQMTSLHCSCVNFTPMIHSPHQGRLCALPSLYDGMTLMHRRMVLMAPFSRRDTWA